MSTPVKPVVVLSGPTAAGKTTFQTKLLADYPRLFRRTLSATTRAPRTDKVSGRMEENGVDYDFIDKDTFKIQIMDREFLEYADVYGNFYGTRISEVTRILDFGFRALLVIDVQGQGLIQACAHPRIDGRFSSIFVTVSNPDMLRNRLLARGTPPDTIQRRMDEFETEHACRTRFDTIINNDDGRLDQAYAEFKAALGL